MLLCLKRAAAEQSVELRVALLLLVFLQDGIKPAAGMEPGGGGIIARPKRILF